MPISLPKLLNVPSNRIQDYCFLFAGVKKIGKTAFCSQWPGHIIAECEPGNAKHLAACYVDIHNWQKFTELVKLLQTSPKGAYETFIVDDVPSLYGYCYKHVRKLLAMAETDKDNFDVWRTIRNLFSAEIQKIQNLGLGIVYTTHVAINTVEDISGRQISKLEPTMSKQCQEIMDNITHFVGMMLRDKDGKRIMVIEGNSFITAGHGFNKSFKSNGKSIIELPLGNSEQEAYSNFIKAWNNQLAVSNETIKATGLGVNVQKRVKPPVGK